MNEKEFIIELKKINITPTKEQLTKLNTYYNLLLEENKKYNLTAITEKTDVYLKHFYDSLTITKIITLNNQYICDIGSGAGFPGIVLKIFYPNIKIDLLDSTTKKCQFLSKVVQTLNLQNVTIINQRAEEYSKIKRETYDIIVSRAVDKLKHLLEYSIPLLKIDGSFIALKSNLSEELININNYYQKLNLHKEKILSFKLPYESSLRTLYKIEKKSKTNKIYPRTYSKIKKQEI